MKACTAACFAASVKWAPAGTKDESKRTNSSRSAASRQPAAAGDAAAGLRVLLAATLPTTFLCSPRASL